MHDDRTISALDGACDNGSYGIDSMGEKMAGDTRQKLLDFLKSKQGAANCEVCQVNNWFVPEDDQAFLNLLIQQKGAAVTIGGPSIPAFYMICQNCGHIRFHAVGAVDPGLLQGRW